MITRIEPMCCGYTRAPFAMQNILHEPIVFAQALTSLFLAILFLQSGLDKVFNFQDNLGWLKGHFSKTPLRSQVKGMLIFIMLAEVVAGILALVGTAQIVVTGDKAWALYGAQLAAIVIVMLFFGQRIAKQYAGAAVLVPYFILCIGEVVLLSISPQ